MRLDTKASLARYTSNAHIVIANTVQSFNRLRLTGYRLLKLDVRSEICLRIELSGIASASGNGHVLEDCAVTFGDIVGAKIRLRKAAHPTVRSIKCSAVDKSAPASRGKRRTYLFRLAFDIGHIEIRAPAYAYCVTRSLPFTAHDERAFQRSRRSNGK